MRNSTTNSNSLPQAIHHSKSQSNIIKGPLYTAYTRNNFGSIPAKHENVIIKPSDITVLQHASSTISKTSPIKLAGRSIRYEILSNSSNSSPTALSNHSHAKAASKSYGGVRHFGDEKRFRNQHMELSCYFPGPGEYSPNFSIYKAKKFRYNSIFNDRKSISLLKSHTVKSINQGTKNVFFHCEDEKDLKTYLGPGCYDLYDTNKFNGGGHHIAFCKEKKFASHNSPFPEDKYSNPLNGPGRCNFQSSFTVKRKNFPSYFFYSKAPKVFTDDEKVEQMNIRECKGKPRNRHNRDKWHERGDKTKDRDKSKVCSLNDEAKKRYEEKEELERKGIDYEQRIKNIKREKLLYQIAMEKFRVFEPKVKGGKCFVFSPSPKESYFTSLVNSKHVPGPCYYNHNSILENTKQKRSFHINSSDIWV